MEINTATALTFLLVMLRMTGLLVFSPIFGRNNVPTMLNAGFAFVMAILLSSSVAPPLVEDPTILPLLLMVFKEMLVGFLAGVILQMFLSVIIVGGEIIDMQLGISMAKAFDPGSNASISVTSSFLNVLFLLIFFVTNNHLTFLYMCAQTFRIIPLGISPINLEVLAYIPELFSTVLIFAMKLCLPVAVIEVVVTMAVGIIMRIIPQINVFVVNIQFKLLVGIFVLMILVPSFTGFFENLIQVSFERIRDAWMYLT